VNDSNVTASRIKCGHCGGYHATVDEVKACASATNVAVSEPPITERQVSYLTDLVRTRVIPDDMALIKEVDITGLTKRHASTAIEILSKQPKAQQGMVIPETIPDGRYAYKHEALNKIVFYRVVTSRDGTHRRVQKVLGSPGDFRYVNVQPGEASNFIDAIKDDPGFASQLFGHAVGACGICGSPLTDPESIRLGIGPICAKKYDW
jgi:hypothetical protein